MSTDLRLRGLYAITPDGGDSAALASQVAAVLRGGARVLQYRRKLTPPARRADEASAVLAACRGHGVPLIVNDDPRLAATIGADGVHLGRDDGDIAAARALLGPRAIIGVSCYDQRVIADDAIRSGADYVAFGSVFATARKPDAPRATLALIERAAAELPRPVCAIGGITLERAPAVAATGVSMIAVIGELFDGSDPQAAAAGFARLFA